MADPTVRVMTWNVRFNNPGDGVNAWPNRAERVGEFIRFLSPDVIGFQEALRGQVDDLARMLPGYDWVGVGRDDGADGGEFSPVFFRTDRFSDRGHGTMWLSTTPADTGSVGWDAALPRVATWIRLSDEAGHAVLVVNTHFDHVGQEARRNSASLIADSVEAWSEGGAALAIGDFNATPESAPYATLASRMRDARVVAGDRHGPDETFFGFAVADTMGRSIDHIFVSGGTEVLRTAVLTEQYRGRYLSDHLPVVADVRLSSPADN